MVERIRLFIGATELDFEEATFSKSKGNLVNKGKAKVVGDASVVGGATLDFKKADGSTTVFSTKIQRITRETTWELEVYSKAWELNNIKIDKLYPAGTSPEAIVEDVVDNFSQSLTYASTSVSGISLDEYHAKGYLIDVITDMKNVLKWDFVINDANGNATFEAPGTNNNGVVLRDGTSGNFTVESWTEEPKRVINHIRVIGGFENILTTESPTGSNTTWVLDHKPSGTFKARIGSTEVDPSTYVVTVETKTVVFSVSKTDPIFEYSYNRPIVIVQQDDDSIAAYGEVFKEFQAPWLNTLSDGRQYTKKLLQLLKNPPITVEGIKPGFDFTLSEGETVQVIDSRRSENESLIIEKIVYDALSNTTQLSLGSADFLIGDWQNEVQQRIKDLEKRSINIEESTEARTISSDFNIAIELTDLSFQYAYPNNSFILGHETLGRLRPDRNYEADCSDNGTDVNAGTWNGSSIDGAQYVSTGWRTGTYAGTFNGTDNYVTVADSSTLDLSADFTICGAVRVASLPSVEKYLIQKLSATDGYAVRITSANKLEVIYRAASADSTLVSTTTLTTNTWYHFSFVKNGTALTCYINGVSDNTGTGGATVGTNSDALEVGRRSSTYFAGDLDEIRVYSDNLSAGDITNIVNFINVTTNLKMYLSFDDPILGDHLSARVDV